MFGLGTSELVLILVIVMVIFGVGKLPEIGGALGRGIRSFKEEMKPVETAKEAAAAEAKKEIA